MYVRWDRGFGVIHVIVFVGVGDWDPRCIFGNFTINIKNFFIIDPSLPLFSK